MLFLLISFIAGFLTVLAPCSIFLLPTILIGSIEERNPLRPWLVTISLGVSVFLFSIIVKGTSLAFVFPESFWSYVSGLLIVFFGVSLLFPDIWKKVVDKFSLYKSNGLLHRSQKYKGNLGAVFLGASLGPVFSTCSPTFAVLLAVILPSDFLKGVSYILFFVLGMMIPFLLIGIGGQKIVKKFKFVANPHGLFRRLLGVFLILVGIIIIGGYQKTIEAVIINNGYLGPIPIENRLNQL